MIRYSAVESCCYFVLRRLWPNHGAGGTSIGARDYATRELNWCSMMSRDFAQASTLNIRFILYLSSLYFVCRRVKIVFLSRIFRNNYWYGSESDLSLFFRCFNEAFHVFILSVTNKDIRSSINCIFISCKNCLKKLKIYLIFFYLVKSV